MGFSGDVMKKSFEEAEDDASLYAFSLITSNLVPEVLKAAIELNIFEIISKGGCMSSFEMASQLPIRNPATAHIKLDRILRLLAIHSLLNCSSRVNPDGTTEITYALSNAGKCYVQDETDGSMASYLTMSYHPAILKVRLNAKEAIVEGGGSSVFEKTHGMPLFQYMEKNESMNHGFNKVMTDFTILSMKKILEVYKGFEGISTLVDVGGGSGTSLKMITSKYPSIRGINFDLPQVIQNAPCYPGIEHVEGDMFLGVPKADAIMMKSTLHDWCNEECLKLLRNCHEALPPNGKVIVLEFLMPETAHHPSFADKCVAGIDMTMYLLFDAQERTEKEFEALCKASGFTSFRVVCRAMSIFGVMEFSK